MLLSNTCGDTQNQLTFRDDHTFDVRCDFELNQAIARRNLFGPETNFLTRRKGLQKFHASDCREQVKRPFCFRTTRSRGNSRRLRQSLGQDHARNDGIAREMSGKHRIALFEPRSRLNRSARIAGNDLPHENERRAMGKAEEVISRWMIHSRSRQTSSCL